jgi:ribonucleoside-triphosphate reductase (formate)
MDNYVFKRNEKYNPFESFKVKDTIEKSFKSVAIAVDKSVVESVTCN